MTTMRVTKERFEIPVDPPDCIDGAVIYLCLLAYPSPADELKRSRLYGAFWAYLIRAARRNGTWKKGADRRHSEILRCFPVQQMWGTLNLANRRIWWRTVAAERFMVYGSMHSTKRKKTRRRDPKDINRDRFWIKKAELPRPKGFSGGRRFEKGVGYVWYVQEYSHVDEQTKPIVTHIVRSIARQLSMPERNVWLQVVRPLRPVLHMADALRSTMLESLDLSDPENPRGVASGPFDCLALVRSPEWIKRAVQISGNTAKYWAAHDEWPALRTFDSRQFMDLVAR